MNERPDLLNDRDIARRVNFSTEWVRQERYRRRDGKPHVLNIDPVIVGTKPRYWAADVDAWFAALKAGKPLGGDLPQ
jgi:hypothetical protein